MAAKKRMTSKEPVQKRSRNKVERVLDAVAALIETMPLNDITVALIAEKSGVGRATIYQFFPTIYAIYNRLGELYMDELTTCIDQDEAARDAPSWQDALDALIDCTVAFHHRNPAARTLFLGDGSVRGIRTVERDYDKRFAGKLREIFGDRLRLPPMAGDPVQVLVIIATSIFSLAVFEDGRINDFYCEQTKLAVRGYLETVIRSGGPAA